VRLHEASQSLITSDIISALAESELVGPEYDSFLDLVDNIYEMAVRSHFFCFGRMQMYRSSPNQLTTFCEKLSKHAFH
jgi:hypothetical protein